MDEQATQVTECYEEEKSECNWLEDSEFSARYDIMKPN